jgi:hypothetical protein
MRRILVVAHRTLGGPLLLEEVGRRMKGGNCRVHLVVPVHHPMGAFSEATVLATAERVLDQGLRRFRDLDPTGSIDITGEVGDSNPIYATAVVHNREEEFDEIIVSTLPHGVSRWLLGDVPKKIQRVYPDAIVTHLVAANEPAHA